MATEIRNRLQLTSAASAALRTSWHWWKGELSACLPPQAKALVGRLGVGVAIEVDNESVVLSRRNGLDWQLCGRVDGSDRSDDEVDQDLARLIAAVELSGKRAIIRLGPRLALRRTLWLPAATISDLRQVLIYEMDRFTPFQPEQVWFEGHPLRTSADGERVQVLLTFAMTRTVDSVSERLVRWGLVPAAIQTVHDRLGDARAVRLKPAIDLSERQERRGPSWAFSAALGVILLALLVVSAVAPLWQRHQQLAVYEAQLDQVRTEALLVSAMREELTVKGTAASFLPDRKAEQPSMMAIWNETTRLLPDTTWLLQLRVERDGLMMSGYSREASSLIETLETSELFNAVEFSAPVTLDARVGSERFNLTAKVLQEARP